MDIPKLLDRLRQATDPADPTASPSRVDVVNLIAAYERLARQLEAVQADRRSLVGALRKLGMEEGGD